MAINNFHKYLDIATPNLSLQSNITQGLLWGTAGKLDGLGITSVVAPTLTSVKITLAPGAFIHDGIVVDYPEGFEQTFTPTPTINLADPLYLIAKSNGPDEGNLPQWSLLAESTFKAQADSKNFAAVIAIYKLQLVPNSTIQQVGFSGDTGVLGWVPSVALGHYIILNGSTANPGAYLHSVTSQDAISIQNLGNNARFVTQAMLTMTVGVNNTNDANTTKSTNGSVTFATVTAPSAGDRFSIFANGIEIAYIANLFDGLTVTVIATKLAALVNAPGSPWVGIATATSLAGVISFTSVQFGNAGNFILTASEDSVTTTSAVVAPSGALQGYIVVDFPSVNGTTSAVPPITVYPPVPISVLTTVFSTVIMSFPIVLSSLTAATFNNLLFHYVAFGAVSEKRIYQAFITVGVTESNFAIDPTPPLQLSHWSPGPNVAVGSGQGTALEAHRTLVPMDHPQRSVSRGQIQLRAVSSQELSSGVIGAGFVEVPSGTSTALLPTPWLIPADLNLEECSDVIKSIAQALGDISGVGSLVVTFARGHNATTGHHKPVLIGSLGNPALDGLQVDVLATGDASTDFPGNALTPWAASITSVSTKGQAAVLSEIVSKSTLISARTAAGVPIGTGTGTVHDLVLASPEQVAAGNIGLAVGMDATNPHITAAYKDTDAKPLSGITKIDNIPVTGFINNEVTLFEGWVVFVRTDPNGSDGGKWALRVGGTKNPFPASFPTRFFNGDPPMVQAGPNTADTGLTMAHTNSFLADSPAFGAAYYADFGSPDNFLSGLTPESVPANSVAGIGNTTALYGGRIDSGLGYFPTPLRGVNTSKLQDASAVSVTGAPSAVVGPAGSEWLYLPFPRKDIFGSVSVEAKVFSFSGGTTPVLDQVPSAIYSGIMVAPAYDAREIATVDAAYALVAPKYAPLSAGQITAGLGAFRDKSTGIVRRTPWILTPYGMGRRIAFSGLTENSYYYDPSNNTADVTYDPYKFFTQALTGFATTYSRATNFQSSFIASNDSYLIRGALPFYDRRRTGETVAGGAKVAGIVLNAAQINGFSGITSQLGKIATATVPAQGYGFTSCGGVVSLLDRYTPSSGDPTRQDFLRAGGGPGSGVGKDRTPDGIAVCMQRWDFGIAGKFGSTAPSVFGTLLPPNSPAVAVSGITTLSTDANPGVVPYSQTLASPNFIEAPIAVYLKITGTVLDRFKLAMSL